MNRSSTVLLLILMCFIFFVRCSDDRQPTHPGPLDNRTPAQLTLAEKSLVESTNRFTFKLFQQVNENAVAGKNVFVSPLSVSYALGMTLNGAEGETRTEMMSALELAGFSNDDANRAYDGLTDVLMQADPAVNFRIANSFWSRLGKAIQPGFLDVCRTYFDARVEEIDFQSPGAADTINHWVDMNTNGKIKKIMEPPLPGNLAALLINALYFKANWSFPFDTEYTRLVPFFLADGAGISCSTMFKDTEEDAKLYDTYGEHPLLYFENELFQGADLPYGDQGFRMTVLLPDSSASADAIIAQMTIENWKAWCELPREEGHFMIALPKFKFEFETSLVDILKAMGMEAAFDGAVANFSNMFVDGVGYISEIKHKTFVQVDEKGTEAAAVTTVVMTDSMPLTLMVNRPFVFVIHELESGAILFIGKVENPTLAN